MALTLPVNSVTVAGMESGESSGDNGSPSATDVPPAPSASDSVDYKTRAERAEAQLAKITGRLGSEKSALLEQFEALKQTAATAEAKAAAAERKLREAAVIDGIASKHPTADRGVLTAVARGFLPELADLSDPDKAVADLQDRITRNAPAALKAVTIAPMPRHTPQGDGAPKPGLVFTANGKRIV